MEDAKMLSVSLLNDVANYLAAQPYREVAQLLARMQQEINAQPPAKPEEKKEET